MSQNYKPISLSEMNPELSNPNQKETVIYFYEDDTKVRSLSIVNHDGDRKNFFYHNLITCDYKAQLNTVELQFTSGVFAFTGKNMLLLYKEIRNYKISEIVLTNNRYIETLNLDEDDIVAFTFTEVKK